MQCAECCQKEGGSEFRRGDHFRRTRQLQIGFREIGTGAAAGEQHSHKPVDGVWLQPTGWKDKLGRMPTFPLAGLCCSQLSILVHVYSPKALSAKIPCLRDDGPDPV